MTISASQNQRPYFSYKYEQLFEVAENNWSNSGGLQELQKELNHRRKPWTIDLKAQVAERLEVLENEVCVRNRKRKNESKSAERFPWVSTEVGFGFEKLDASGWSRNNLLSELGYRTGKYNRDCDTKTRRQILYKAFEEDIPKKVACLFNDINNWGNPNSATRLRKIAESIALEVRSKKLHSYDYSVCISERESDLADLKKKYYDGKYDK